MRNTLTLLRNRNFYLIMVAICFILLTQGCSSETEQQSQNLPDPLEAGWKGESVCEVLQEDTSIRMLKCVFPPGVGHERHFHSKHIGYTIAGAKMQITDSTGTRVLDVKSGGSFNSDGVAWHEVLNLGETTGEFLIIEYK